MSSLKDQAVKGFFWKAVEKVASFGINFLFSVLIARLLLPADFGIVGMIGIFLAISQTFIDSGFGAALIRKLDRTQTDFCTVFYFNIAVSLLFYAILFVCAPFIAGFYNIPELTPITRAMGINLIIGALAGIQGAKLHIDLNFKASAKIQLVCGISSGCVGLILAYSGFGVWTIVFQALLSSALRSLLLWILIRWKPNLVFSWKSFREMFGFGSKLLASALLDTGYNNLTPMIVGKAYSAQTLGMYSQAYNWANIPSANFTGIIQSVTFPVLSKMQEDMPGLTSAYKRFIRMSAFVVFPLLFILSSLAEPLIGGILGEKWLGAAPLLAIVCFSMMWYPVHAINLNILQVLGRSDYFLKLEIIKKIQGVAVLCITVPISIEAMCWGGVISSPICLIYNTYYTKKLIGYGFLKQMRDLFPILAASGVAWLVGWGLSGLFSSMILGAAVGAVAALGIYLLIALALKWRELTDVLDIARNTFGLYIRAILSRRSHSA